MGPLTNQCFDNTVVSSGLRTFVAVESDDPNISVPPPATDPNWFPSTNTSGSTVNGNPFQAARPIQTTGTYLTSFSIPASEDYGFNEELYFAGQASEGGDSGPPAIGFGFETLEPAYPFKSFVIPAEDSPITGENLQIFVDGSLFEYQIGETFDFLQIDSAGINRFYLIGINSSNGLSAFEATPFTFGLSFNALDGARLQDIDVVSLIDLVLGDVNRDGLINLLDIEPFIDRP